MSEQRGSTFEGRVRQGQRSTRGPLLAFIGLSFVLVAAATAVEGPQARVDPSVILISLDGTRPADVTPETLPSLLALASRGAVAQRLVPVVPANTFPNHVTLVTGVSPARHGIVNNVFRDPDKGIFKKKNIPDWIEVEPLWSQLERQGVVTAAYHWVGSEGVWRDGRAPTHWKRFSKRTRERTKVKQILAWLDLPEGSDRPHFISSWFHGADHAGHHQGPGSAAVHEALREQDAALAALIDGIESRGLFDSTTLIVVSDHGMAKASRRVDLGTALEQAGMRARVFGIGGFAIVEVGGRRAERPARIERAIGVARALGLDAFARTDAPKGFECDDPRFGDLIVRAPVGVAIVYRKLGPLLGFHGYAPDAPEMAAIFFAAGRRVAPGTRLGEVRSIDVAPSVLTLLGVPVPGWMQGRPIEALMPSRPSSAKLPAGRTDP